MKSDPKLSRWCHDVDVIKVAECVPHDRLEGVVETTRMFKLRPNGHIHIKPDIIHSIMKLTSSSRVNEPFLALTSPFTRLSSVTIRRTVQYGILGRNYSTGRQPFGTGGQVHIGDVVRGRVTGPHILGLYTAECLQQEGKWSKKITGAS